MKKNAISAIAVVLLLLLFAWWLLRPKATPHDQISSASQKSFQQAPKATNGPASTTSRTGDKEQPADFQRTWEETMRKAYETPMDMYGIVLDEHDHPVEGATAKFSWNPIHGDTLTATATTDASGHFSFTGRKGISLGVDVSKPGYYQMRNEDASRRNFDFYAPPGKVRYTSDPSHPTIFRLKKAGEGAPLVRHYVDVNLPADGSTIIDLNTGQVSPNGDLEFTLKRSRGELPFTWEAQARVMNGGFAKAEGQFLFTAPESGYQEQLTWSFPLNEQGRQPRTDFEETYYIAFGSLRKYGRIRFWVKADTRVLIVETFVNPTGDRNLEPVPKRNVGTTPNAP